MSFHGVPFRMINMKMAKYPALSLPPSATIDGRAWSRATTSSRNIQVVCRASSIRARWCFDCRYGTKMKAVDLLKEWIQEIGSLADPGLSEDNARINSGSIGSPESRLELEVEFGSLEELERFWASIPAHMHQEWSRHVADVIIDGSPTWEVYRSVDPFLPDGSSQKILTSRNTRHNVRRMDNDTANSVSSLEIASKKDIDKFTGSSFGKAMRTAKDIVGTRAEKNTSVSGPSGMDPHDEQEGDDSSGERNDSSDNGGDEKMLSESESHTDHGTRENVVLDWKGDPMRINPRDKLPFTFDS